MISGLSVPPRLRAQLLLNRPQYHLYGSGYRKARAVLRETREVGQRGRPQVAKRSRPEVRFAVIDADGRRSSVWRVIVNGNQAYLSAESMLGQVKISLHYNGYCQQGLTEKVRKLLPPGKERAALDRWYQPRGEPGILEPAYMIYFTGSQLVQQEEALAPETLLIPSTGRDQEVRVGLFFVEPPLPEVVEHFGPLRYLARLPLRSGAALDLLWCELPREEGRVEGIKHMYYNGLHRELPVVLSEERHYAYGFGARPPDGSQWVGKRSAVEISVNSSQEVRLISWRTGTLREERYEATGDTTQTCELLVFGRRYLRLKSDYRDFAEAGGLPIYVQDHLMEVEIEQAVRLDGRDEAEVANEVHGEVVTRVELLARRHGGLALMRTEVVSLPSGVVVGFCLMVRPVSTWRGWVTSLRSRWASSGVSPATRYAAS